MVNRPSIPQLRYIQIDKLKFDPQNPRIPTDVNGADEKTVLEWMLQDATIIELMGSIGEQGYFPGEPILVVPDTENSDYFIVVEGNRRLSASKLLLNPELARIRQKAVTSASQNAKIRPNELPVIIYENRNDILDYLGYRHITGIKAWDPLAKARYLKQLADKTQAITKEDQFKKVAKTIGSRSDHVAKLLTGLEIYEEIAENNFFDIKGLNEDGIEFSILTTALGYTGIVEFLGLETGQDTELEGLDKAHLKELTSWMFEKDIQRSTRLGESRNLQELSAVVTNNQALEAFRDGIPLKDAFKLTESPSEIFRGSILDARGNLQTANSYLYLVEDLKHSDSERINEIIRLLRDMDGAVKNRLSIQ